MASGRRAWETEDASAESASLADGDSGQADQAPPLAVGRGGTQATFRVDRQQVGSKGRRARADPHAAPQQGSAMVSFDVSAYESVDADAAASGRLPLTFRQITRVMVHILERLREPPLSASDASPMHARPEDNDDGLGGDGASATAAFVLQILVHPHEIAIPRAAFGSIVICLLRMLPFNLVPATTLTPVVPFAAAPILKALARRSRHEVGSLSALLVGDLLLAL